MSESKRSTLYANAILTGILLAANLVVANILLQSVDKRWDLTDDKRFEISSSTQNILDKVEGTVSVKCYFSSELPKAYNHIERIVAEKMSEYEQLSQGKVIFEIVDPVARGNEDDLRDLNDMGIQPVQLEQVEGAKDRKVLDCYLVMVYRYGDRKQIVNLFQDFGQALGSPSDFASQLEFVSTQAIHNTASPRKTVGILADIKVPDKRNPQQQIPPGTQGFEYLKQYVGRLHDIKVLDPVEVNRGARIPNEIDVVICAGLDNMTEAGQFVIDQYLMHGGDILFLVDQGRVDSSPKMKTMQAGNQQIQDFDMPSYDSVSYLDNMTDLIAHYGLKVLPYVIEDRSAMTVSYLKSKEVKQNAFRQVYVNPIYGQAEYPSWTLIPARDSEGKIIDSNQVNPAWPLLSSTDQMLGVWSFPIELNEEAISAQKLSHEILVQSGPKSWRRSLKDNAFSPVPGEWSEPAEKERSNFVMKVEGKFQSYFAGREIPKVKNASGNETEVNEELVKNRLDGCAEAGRIIVVGDADFVADDTLQSIVYLARAGQMPQQEIRDYIMPFFTTVRFNKNLVDLLCYGDEAKDMFLLLNREVRSRNLKDIEEGSDLMKKIVGINLYAVPGFILLLGLLRVIYRRLKTGAVSV